MLQDIDDIVLRVGALLDDPANNQFTGDYLQPYIDEEYDELDTELEALGMQYVESVAIFDVQPGVSNLGNLNANGGALQFMKFPLRVRWKLVGQEDLEYKPSALVQELDEVSIASLGALEWRNANGAIQITPSSSAVTLKVYYDAMSSDVWDPQTQVIRGTAHILACRVAFYVAGIRGMDLAPRLEKKAGRAWDVFSRTLSKVKQAQLVMVPKTHRTRRVSTPAGYV